MGLKAKYKLHATRVDRIAVVDRPAVPDAEICLFKRHKEIVEDKGATPYKDLPLADKGMAWDSTAAEGRVREWAGGADKTDWGKYRQAFMWYDSEKPENFTSYKLQYADIVDGELKAVPRAIIAIVQVLAGGRGGVDIPENDKKKVLSQCRKYYDKMGMEPAEIMKLEKQMEMADFNTPFAYGVASKAVEVLQQLFWQIFYADEADKSAAWGQLFADATTAIKNTLSLVKLEKQEAQKMSASEIVSSFMQAMKSIAISDMFAFLGSNIGSIIVNNTLIDNPAEAIDKIMAEFQGSVVNMATEIITQKKMCPVVLDKEGRVIASARLAKLKEALEVLQGIIKDGEEYLTRNTEKSQNNKEAEQMEIKELIEKLEKLSAAVELLTPLVKRLEVIEGVMKEKGMLLTEEEIKQAEAAKVEADKKLAEAKVEADKKLAEQVEADKKAKEEVAVKAEARLVKMEEAITKFSKITEAIEKKFGKTSIEGDEGDNKGDKGDVFGKALKGKK